MAKIYRFRFKAKPLQAYPFPLDMLRYDGCYPHTQSDAGRVEGTIREYDARKDMEPVTLEKVTDDHQWRPNYDRWRSMGWEAHDLQRMT